MIFFEKMKGNKKTPPRVSFSEIFWSWAGGFLGISIVGFLHYRFFSPNELTMLIGSFGASAVLVFGAIKSPLAQPRNVLGGHVISALVGVATLKLIPDPLWLSSGISVATAIAIMHATRTLHPPGGATALIAVTGGEKIKALGYMYAFVPAGLGALILLVVALFINNIPQDRSYPESWL